MLRVVAILLLFGRLWTRLCFLAGRGHVFAFERVDRGRLEWKVLNCYALRSKIVGAILKAAFVEHKIHEFMRCITQKMWYTIRNA